MAVYREVERWKPLDVHPEYLMLPVLAATDPDLAADQTGTAVRLPRSDHYILENTQPNTAPYTTRSGNTNGRGYDIVVDVAKIVGASVGTEITFTVQISVDQAFTTPITLGTFNVLKEGQTLYCVYRNHVDDHVSPDTKDVWIRVNTTFGAGITSRHFAMLQYEE